MVNFKNLLNKTTKAIKDSSVKLNKTIIKQLKEIKDKRNLINTLTTKELEKVYINYIDNYLYKEVRNIQTDKLKRIRLTRNDLKSRIMRKVKVENIINSTPRIKKRINVLNKTVVQSVSRKEKRINRIKNRLNR